MTAAGPSVAKPWVRRMVARDDTSQHRASTNLELLFDLTFVVAVAAVARELAHDLAAGHYSHGLFSYVTVFFAIWWAWVNFTWFASAFDTDDVPYRLLTMVQMAGVLLLAASIPRAFETGSFVGVTLGYVVMRVAMVGQWLRAAASDPEYRATCLRYASGITVVQIGWIVRLVLPHSVGTASFVVLVIAEMLVPPFAERRGMTTWHPGHIAERYSLFTIIVLGECVTQVAAAVEASYSENGVSAGLVVTALAGLVLLFGLWWVYFIVDQGGLLREKRQNAFAWGYGHLVIFASLAAVAAGLEVALFSLTGHVEVSRLAVMMAIAVPVAIYLIAYGSLTRLLGAAGGRQSMTAKVVAAVATVLLALTATVWSVPVVGVLVVVPTVLLVAYSVYRTHSVAVG